MTGPEHYREADRILTELVNDETGHSAEFPPETLLAMAQVHATLAHTAATVLAAISPLQPRETFPLEVQAWRDATGTKAAQ